MRGSERRGLWSSGQSYDDDLFQELTGIGEDIDKLLESHSAEIRTAIGIVADAIIEDAGVESYYLLKPSTWKGKQAAEPPTAVRPTPTRERSTRVHFQETPAEDGPHINPIVDELLSLIAVAMAEIDTDRSMGDGGHVTDDFEMERQAARALDLGLAPPHGIPEPLRPILSAR